MVIRGNRVTDCVLDVADRSTDLPALTPCGAATEQGYICGIGGTKLVVSLSLTFGRCP